MSRTYSTKKDEHQKRSKVNYRAYFNNPDDPWENASTDMPAELEAELLENSGLMRHKFRRFARKARNRNA